jgi:hypothetical protein
MAGGPAQLARMHSWRLCASRIGDLSHALLEPIRVEFVGQTFAVRTIQQVDCQVEFVNSRIGTQVQSRPSGPTYLAAPG